MAQILLKPASGGAPSGDFGARQSESVAYIGSGAGTSSVTGKALGSAYQDNTSIDTGKADIEINMEDFDTLIAVVDYTKSAGTDLQCRAMYGDSAATAQLLAQEDREDHSTANTVTYEKLDHKMAATGVFVLVFKRVQQFMKLQFKSGGTPDSGDLVAVQIYGQVREK